MYVHVCVTTLLTPSRLYGDAQSFTVCISSLLFFLTGASVQQVLKIIEVLDEHSFTRCRGHNPLTALYVKLCAVQTATEVHMYMHVPPLSGHL